MNLNKTIIAWLYMVPADEGLSAEKIRKLLDQLPVDVDVIPFSNDVGGQLEANSVAYGFYDGEYDHLLPHIHSVTAEVCNDWDKETEDHLYEVYPEHFIAMYS